MTSSAHIDLSRSEGLAQGAAWGIMTAIGGAGCTKGIPLAQRQGWKESSNEAEKQGSGRTTAAMTGNKTGGAGPKAVFKPASSRKIPGAGRPRFWTVTRLARSEEAMFDPRRAGGLVLPVRQ